MKVLIPIILLSITFAVTPYNITNQDYNLNDVSRFVRSFDNNKLTDSDIYHIWYNCQAWKIHPLIALSFLEKETSLISNPEEMGRYNWRKNRAMGYGLLEQTWTDKHKFYKHGNFQIQVYCGIKAIHKSFNRWYNKKLSVVPFEIKDGEPVQIDNVMDYILYRYTPYIHGKTSFDSIYSKFNRIWINING